MLSYDASIQARINDCQQYAHTKTGQVSKAQDLLRDENTKIWKKISDLEGLCNRLPTSRGPTSEPSLDTLANTALVRIRAHGKGKIGKQQLISYVKQQCDMAGLPEDCFKLVGPPISGRFKLRFDLDGVPHKTAEQRCVKFLQTTNWRTNGDYPVHSITGPLERVQLFFQADESARQKVLGSHGRALKRAINEILHYTSQNQSRCFVESQTGDILFQWVPVANFKPITSTKAVYTWDLEGAKKVEWSAEDMDKIDARYKEIVESWQNRS